MNKELKFFIIDGMALIYRAHFAMIKNPLTTKNGQHTSAIYGFANSIFKLIKDENPDYLAIAMDCKQPTFRHEMYSEYKANRETMPDELVSQLSLIDEMLDSMNIPVIKKPGFEAVFLPIPSTPGILSDESPSRAKNSIILFGLTPHLSNTSDS